jgi:hypothetical protein
MLCLGFYSVNSPFRLACAFTREFLVLKRRVLLERGFISTPGRVSPIAEEEV